MLPAPTLCQPASWLHPTCTLTAFACIPLAPCLNAAPYLQAERTLPARCLHSPHPAFIPPTRCLHPTCTLPAPCLHLALTLLAFCPHPAHTLHARSQHRVCSPPARCSRSHGPPPAARPVPAPCRCCPLPVPPSSAAAFPSSRLRLAAAVAAVTSGDAEPGGHRGAGTGSARAALRHRGVIVGRAALEVGVVEVMMVMGMES